MLTSQYLNILAKKMESLENGTMPEEDIPGAYLLFKHHNLTDLSFINSQATLSDIPF